MNLKLFSHSRKIIQDLKDKIPVFVNGLRSTITYMRVCKACASFIGEGVYCGKCFNKVDELLPPIWMNNGLHFYCEKRNNEYEKMAYHCNELEHKNQKKLQM